MFNSIMHVAFYTDKWDEMLDFYTNKLGLKIKTYVKFKEYLNRPDRKEMYERALKEPEAPFNCYIEIAPGQFIELFPKMPDQSEDTAEWNSRLGYSHFALTVDDIFESKKELEENGVFPLSKPSKGPSNTWQCGYADPDGNRFEMMQYTELSYQIVGHID